VAFTLYLVYFPLANIPMAPGSDDHKIFWDEFTRLCCHSAFDSPNWKFVGRPIGSILATLQQSYIFDLVDLSISRALSLVVLVGGCIVYFCFILGLGLPTLFAAAISVGTFMAPGFSQGIAWGHASVFLIVPPIVTLIAGILVHHLGFLGIVDGTSKKSIVRDVIGLVISQALLQAMMWTYPATASFYIIPFAAFLMIGGGVGHPRALRYSAFVIASFCVHALIYYVAHRFYYQPLVLAQYPVFKSYGENVSFALVSLFEYKAIVAKLLVLEASYARSGFLWFFEHTRLANTALMALWGGMAAAAFAAWWLRQKRTDPARLKIRYLAIWGGVIVTLYLLANAANLAAVGGSVGYRVLISLHALNVLLLAWILLQLGAVVWKAAPAAIATVVMTVSVATGAILTQQYSVWSGTDASLLYGYLRSQLASKADLHIQSVHMIEPYLAKVLPYHSQQSFTGSKRSDMIKTEASQFLTYLALGEIGYRYPLDFKFLTHQAGDIIVLHDNDVLLDLNDLTPPEGTSNREFLAYLNHLKSDEFGQVGRDYFIRANEFPYFEITNWRQENGIELKRLDQADPAGGKQATNFGIDLCRWQGDTPRLVSRPVGVEFVKDGTATYSIWFRPEKGVTATMIGATVMPSLKHLRRVFQVKPEQWQRLDFNFPAPKGAKQIEVTQWLTADAKPASGKVCKFRANFWGATMLLSGGIRTTNGFGIPKSKILTVEAVPKLPWNPHFPLTNLFDGAPRTMWETPIKYPITLAFKAVRNADVPMFGYSVATDKDNGEIRMPLAWRLEGSAGDGTWHLLDSQDLQEPWVAGEIKTFAVAEPRAFALYRLVLERGGHPGLIRMGDLKFAFEPLLVPK